MGKKYLLKNIIDLCEIAVSKGDKYIDIEALTGSMDYLIKNKVMDAYNPEKCFKDDCDSWIEKVPSEHCKNCSTEYEK